MWENQRSCKGLVLLGCRSWVVVLDRTPRFEGDADWPAAKKPGVASEVNRVKCPDSTGEHWVDQLSPASTIDGKYMCTIRNGRIEVTARGATQDNAYAWAIRKLTMKLVEKKRRH
jgi:hypothetical protein